MATAARTCEIAAAHTARCVCEIAIPQGRWRSLWMSQSRCTSRWYIARGVAIARAACVAGGRAWRARQCVAQLDEMCLRDCHSASARLLGTCAWLVDELGELDSFLGAEWPMATAARTCEIAVAGARPLVCQVGELGELVSLTRAAPCTHVVRVEIAPRRARARSQLQVY